MAQEQRLAGILRTLAQRLSLPDLPLTIPVHKLKIAISPVPTLKDLSFSVVGSVSGLASRSKGAANLYIDYVSDYLRRPPASVSLPESMALEMPSPMNAIPNSAMPFDEAMRQIYVSNYPRIAFRRQSGDGELLSFSTTHSLRSDEDSKEDEESKRETAFLPKEIKPTTTIVPTKAETSSRFVASKASIDSRTRGLVTAIRTARSSFSKLSRIEEMAKHLMQYPDAKIEAVRIGAIPLLLGFIVTGDSGLKSQTSLTLSLLGYSFPPDAPGPRILSVDGGGARYVWWNAMMAFDLSIRLIVGLTGSLIDWLFDWLTSCLIDWLIDCCSIDWLIVRLIDWLISWMFYTLVDIVVLAYVVDMYQCIQQA